MSLFGKVIKTIVNAAALPVEVAKDVVTLGGVSTTGNFRPYTAKRIEKLGKPGEQTCQPCATGNVPINGCHYYSSGDPWLRCTAVPSAAPVVTESGEYDRARYLHMMRQSVPVPDAVVTRVCRYGSEHDANELCDPVKCGNDAVVSQPEGTEGVVQIRNRITIKQAIQLTWANWNAICSFVPKPWFVRGVWLDENGNPTPDDQWRFGYGNDSLGLILRTLESNEFLARGDDWIIRGLNGEFYACKPDIFAKSYEILSASPTPVVSGQADDWHLVADGPPDYDRDVHLWAADWDGVYCGYWRHSEEWIGRHRAESVKGLPTTNPTHWNYFPSPPSLPRAGETE